MIDAETLDAWQAACDEVQSWEWTRYQRKQGVDVLVTITLPFAIAEIRRLNNSHFRAERDTALERVRECQSEIQRLERRVEKLERRD